MTQDKFPYQPCHVCKTEILRLEGYVAALSLPHDLEDLNNEYGGLGALLESPVKLLAKAIAEQYLLQQPSDDEETDSHNPPPARTILTDILSATENEQIYLLCHEDCLPSDIWEASYIFELDRINTPRKAIEWTIHLAEKPEYNGMGWAKLLEDLFGRYQC